MGIAFFPLIYGALKYLFCMADLTETMSKPDQAVGTVGHEERHIQNLAIQFEIFSDPKNAVVSAADPLRAAAVCSPSRTVFTGLRDRRVLYHILFHVASTREEAALGIPLRKINDLLFGSEFFF